MKRPSARINLDTYFHKNSKTTSLLWEHIKYRILFHIFDILVVPSRWEPFRIVIIEAMAAGTPVVSFAVGGIPEIIRNRVDGFLIEPNNVQLLAEKLLLFSIIKI
ncbi:MAG: glycosyltransferase family 4 protein [bacterium]|nr:glycosyltransferase family 4 protein [bacterium]